MHNPLDEQRGRPDTDADAGQAFGRGAGRRGLLALACPILPASAAAAASAHGQPTARDLQLVARELRFLEQPPSGLVEVGIVYPGGSPEGRAEAGQLAALFEGGVRAGAVTLRPRPLTIEDVPAAGMRVVLLTGSAVLHAAALARRVAAREVLTVTFDPPVVDEGLAVLAVRSQPRVEVLVSRAAARAAGVGFAGAFRMMIQER